MIADYITIDDEEPPQHIQPQPLHKYTNQNHQNATTNYTTINENMHGTTGGGGDVTTPWEREKTRKRQQKREQEDALKHAKEIHERMRFENANNRQNDEMNRIYRRMAIDAVRRMEPCDVCCFLSQLSVTSPDWNASTKVHTNSHASHASLKDGKIGVGLCMVCRLFFSHVVRRSTLSTPLLSFCFLSTINHIAVELLSILPSKKIMCSFCAFVSQKKSV